MTAAATRPTTVEKRNTLGELPSKLRKRISSGFLIMGHSSFTFVSLPRNHTSVLRKRGNIVLPARNWSLRSSKRPEFFEKMAMSSLVGTSPALAKKAPVIDIEKSTILIPSLVQWHACNLNMSHIQKNQQKPQDMDHSKVPKDHLTDLLLLNSSELLGGIA
jgi:hypothetical protein